MAGRHYTGWSCMGAAGRLGLPFPGPFPPWTLPAASRRLACRAPLLWRAAGAGATAAGGAGGADRDGLARLGGGSGLGRGRRLGLAFLLLPDGRVDPQLVIDEELVPRVRERRRVATRLAEPLAE